MDETRNLHFFCFKLLLKQSQDNLGKKFTSHDDRRSTKIMKSHKIYVNIFDQKIPDELPDFFSRLHLDLLWWCEAASVPPRTQGALAPVRA